MPSTYAHYYFGMQVLKSLDQEIKELIAKYQPLFDIGLHGPDILFYYKPLIANIINQKGHEIHSKTGSCFLEKAKKIVSSCPKKEAASVYILGFICHFMLDSECHPYINEVTKTTGISHSEIETEFERLLMLDNQIEPLSYKPTRHIIPQKEYATYISWFYEGVTPKEIYKALKSMKFNLSFLVAPGKLKRFIIAKALKLTGNFEGMNGLVMSYKPNQACVPSSIALRKLLENVKEPTVNLVNEFYHNLPNLEPLNIRFLRTFA